MCFLSAIAFEQLIVSVKANPYTNVSVSEAKAMIDADPTPVILDVRYQYEYDDGHIRNAILIPSDQLSSRLDELDKEKDTLVYCRSGGRSAAACGILDGNGFTNVYNMLGGILAWIDAGYPIEVVFNVVWAAETYPVVTFSNSTITNFDFNQPLKQISLDVTGTDGTTGFCNVTIPIVLLDGDFTVLIDETPVGYALAQTASHSFIYFGYSHTTKHVKIVGTTVIDEPTPPPVPEFPIGMALEISSISVIIYMLRKNRRKQNLPS